MITAISRIPKGASKSVLTRADPPNTEEEIQKIKSGAVLRMCGNEENIEIKEADRSEPDDELARALSAADALGKASKSSVGETDDSLTDALKELDMDNYDEEDDGVEIFGSGHGNVYYPSNDMDPYLNNEEDDDSEEEEDITIKPDDEVIVCARDEDDYSHLEVWILSVSNNGYRDMYILHDISIPATPLCTAWFDFPFKGGDKGNFIAVGSMEPAIEIWNLDIMDEVQPSATLGGIIGTMEGQKLYKDGSHTDSVLGIAWNKEYSADKLVKIWDVATESCYQELQNHTDKVQAVAWNHFDPKVLLSGSFDHSVVMKDVNSPSHNGFRWPVAANVESLAWDPHTEHSFVASLENGTVTGFDIRTASSGLFAEPKPSFTIHAHDKAVCTIAYNSSLPNLLATGSTDKMVKLWDLSDHPSCIASINPKAGAVISVSFLEDCPFTLAVGGSEGKLKVCDLLSEAEVARRYGKYANEARPPAS